MSDIMTNSLLRFVQIGDLHLTAPDLPNHQDFLRIVAELNRHVGTGIDFVFLPGDNADDGTPDQFVLVREGLNRLRLPWHAIPGDHDFKPRSLDNFYRGIAGPQLPHSVEVNGILCLFLDVVSQGSGGPDFRLGAAQLAWLKEQLGRAGQAGKRCAVFMHSYPADLRADATELAQLLDESSALLVAMGHTHYNEVTHDGRTIYAATRSTGQIEEGPVGFSFAAIDGNVVSWRFKPLKSPWPFVMITAPADRRLALADRPQQARDQVRACVWGASPAAEVAVRIDDRPWQPMAASGAGLFSAPLDVPSPRYRLEVRATDQGGASDTDGIEVDALGAPARSATGSDRNSIGAWPERHLLATQLGPNRNGRKW